jgi:hypothetical protein
MFVASLEGLPEALAKIRETYKRKGDAVERGLKKAGLQLQRWSQQIVPVDYGILKGSAFTRKTKGEGFNAEVQVGYTANYAIWVHENIDNAHGAKFNLKHAEELAEHPTTGPYRHSRGPNQTAKFLENPAREHAQDIKNIVAEEARRG